MNHEGFEVVLARQSDLHDAVVSAHHLVNLLIALKVFGFNASVRFMLEPFSLYKVPAIAHFIAARLFFL